MEITQQKNIDQRLKDGLPLVYFDGLKSETESVISIASRYGRRVRVLPDEGYNPLNEGATPDERAFNFAEVYGQASGLGGDGQYFVQFSQQFLQTVILMYERTAMQPMILNELIDLLINEEARKELLKKSSPMWEERLVYVSHFDGWKQKQFDSTIGGLTLFLRRIADADIKDKYNIRNAPTLAEMIANNEAIIIQEGGKQNNVNSRLRGLCFKFALQIYNRRQRGKSFLPIYFDQEDNI